MGQADPQPLAACISCIDWLKKRCNRLQTRAEEDLEERARRVIDGEEECALRREAEILSSRV